MSGPMSIESCAIQSSYLAQSRLRRLEASEESLGHLNPGGIADVSPGLPRQRLPWGPSIIESFSNPAGVEYGTPHRLAKHQPYARTTNGASTLILFGS